MIVQVEFLDHCEGGAAPLGCRVFGRLVEITPKYLTVRYWETLAETAVTRRMNDENYVIVRAAVQRVTVLSAG